jgi:quercetin dioxygenase-like cupin family protein
LLQDIIAQLKKIKLKQDTGLADYQDMQVYSDSNQALEDTGRPYQNLSVTKDCIIRQFSSDANPDELKWHQDDEDRVVTVLECGKGWGFQYDNELPYELEPGDILFILRHEWHRVVKGTGDLIIKIDTNGEEKIKNFNNEVTN